MFHPRLNAEPTEEAFADLQRDRPTAPCGILPQSAHLHRERLLIIGGDAGIQPRPEHFRWSASLAGNVLRELEAGLGKAGSVH
jgi:hypothetical protein